MGNRFIIPALIGAIILGFLLHSVICQPSPVIEQEIVYMDRVRTVVDTVFVDKVDTIYVAYADTTLGEYGRLQTWYNSPLPLSPMAYFNFEFKPSSQVVIRSTPWYKSRGFSFGSGVVIGAGFTGLIVYLTK